MERTRTLRSKIAQKLYSVLQNRHRMPERVLVYNALIMIEETEEIALNSKDPNLISKNYTTEIEIPPHRGEVLIVSGETESEDSDLPEFDSEVMEISKEEYENSL